MDSLIKRGLLFANLVVGAIILSFIWATPVQAQSSCDLQDCLPQESGWCGNGAVMDCLLTEGSGTARKRCEYGQWVDAPGAELATHLCVSDAFIVQRSWVVDSSEEYVSELNRCATGEVSFECILTKATAVTIQAFSLAAEHAGSRGENLSLAMIANPPVHTKEYLAYVRNQIGVPPAYAQGGGFVALSPIMNLWRLFRNIAYLFFVLVFAVVGLMIVLQKRIDPRTVVTIQDSLPRIIVALILVTFSYALAGIVVDLSNLSSRVIGNLFMNQGYIAQRLDVIRGTYKPEPARLDDLLSYNVFQLVKPIYHAAGIKAAIQAADIPVINLPLFGDIALIALVDITAFITMFRLFLSLLSPYITIILTIILGPMNLALAALPSQGDAVAGWLRRLFANAVVFPAVFVMLSIAAIMRSSSVVDTMTWFTNPENEMSGFWSPTTIGYWGTHLGELVAFGIFIATPKLADEIKEKLSIRPTQLEQGATEALRSGLGRIPIIGGAIR
jgi:hypothetical protein